MYALRAVIWRNLRVVLVRQKMSNCGPGSQFRIVNQTARHPKLAPFRLLSLAHTSLDFDKYMKNYVLPVYWLKHRHTKPYTLSPCIFFLASQHSQKLMIGKLLQVSRNLKNSRILLISTTFDFEFASLRECCANQFMECIWESSCSCGCAWLLSVGDSQRESAHFKNLLKCFFVPASAAFSK